MAMLASGMLSDNEDMTGDGNELVRCKWHNNTSSSDLALSLSFATPRGGDIFFR
jgi:hypothetical protein